MSTMPGIRCETTPVLTRPLLQVIIKWRGKPVFIRHRTASEIQEANKVNVTSLRDPQSDSDRVQKPEWLVMLGMCSYITTLGRTRDCD